MYISKAILEGLRILGFDNSSIKQVCKEKDLEEIFLSTLFLNYIIVLVLYFLAVFSGGVAIEGKMVNMPVFFGLILIYPFIYNIVVYGLYSLFGNVAEMLEKKDRVKQLISVGFHTGIVYTLVLYVIGLLATFDLTYGGVLLAIFVAWFLVIVFYSISVIYKYSFGQVLMTILIPLLLISIGLLVLVTLFPTLPTEVIRLIYS